MPQPDHETSASLSRCTQLRTTISQLRASLAAKRSPLGSAAITDSQEQLLVGEIRTLANQLAAAEAQYELAGCTATLDDDPLVFTITGRPVASLSAFDDLVRQGMVGAAGNGVTSAQLAIAHHGALVYSRAYTFGDAFYPITQPINWLRLASVSKTITGLAIHKLVDEGLLTPVDSEFLLHRLPITTPSGGAPVDGRLGRWSAITLRHLLNHQSGVGILSDDIGFAGDYFVSSAFTGSAFAALPVNQAQITQAGAMRPLLFPPGTSPRNADGTLVDTYSNYGYMLLGRCVQQASGLSYEQYVREHLFGSASGAAPIAAIGSSLPASRYPLEVPYCDRGKAGGSVMNSHNPPDLVPPPYGTFNVGNLGGAGGWVMAAQDYVRLLAKLHDGSTQLLSTKGQEGFFSGPVIANARHGCWDGFGSGNVLMKGGKMPGSGCWALHLPERHLSLAFFANNSIDPADFPVAPDMGSALINQMLASFPADLVLLPFGGRPPILR